MQSRRYYLRRKLANTFRYLHKAVTGQTNEEYKHHANQLSKGRAISNSLYYKDQSNKLLEKIRKHAKKIATKVNQLNDTTKANIKLVIKYIIQFSLEATSFANDNINILPDDIYDKHDIIDYPTIMRKIESTISDMKGEYGMLVKMLHKFIEYHNHIDTLKQVADKYTLNKYLSSHGDRAELFHEVYVPKKSYRRNMNVVSPHYLKSGFNQAEHELSLYSKDSVQTRKNGGASFSSRFEPGPNFGSTPL
jgi:hypothetical protein